MKRLECNGNALVREDQRLKCIARAIRIGFLVGGCLSSIRIDFKMSNSIQLTTENIVLWLFCLRTALKRCSISETERTSLGQWVVTTDFEWGNQIHITESVIPHVRHTLAVHSQQVYIHIEPLTSDSFPADLLWLQKSGELWCQLEIFEDYAELKGLCVG